MSVPADHLPEEFFTGLFPDAPRPVPGGASSATADAGFLARVLDHLPGLVGYLDTEMQCRWANRALRQHVHPDGPDLAGAPLQDLFATELLEAMLPALAQGLRGQAQTFEARGHDGHGRWRLLGQIVPDTGPSGVQGLFCHLQHAEPAPEAAQPGNEAEHRLRLMLDGLRDHALYFVDPQGRVSEWSASAQRLLGYAAQDVLGSGLERFNAPTPREDDELDADLALERAALFGQFESTGWRQRQDGSRFWGQVVLTALRDERSGESLGFSCLTRDMTEVKRLQELLQDLNQTLEQRVQERTRQLLEANRDLESFSTSVSHDLRAPLRHITSFADILQQHLGDRADPTTLKHLQTIAAAAQRMTALIEGLLAFSRLGLAPLSKRPVGMATQVGASINRLSHDLGTRQVEWDIPADLPTVSGDALLLSQVWDNLLGNALKYSRPRPCSQVRVGWREQPGEGLLFWVADNGVGFDPARAHRLFGVFQRLHRASEFEGTGIGLALCRRIIERHGGRIWAEARPGEGSTFYFVLPAGGTA